MIGVALETMGLTLLAASHEGLIFTSVGGPQAYDHSE